jgi:hypothetical protein
VNLDDLRTEYDTARRHTHRIVEGLDDTEVLWRPHPDSSAIGWHLGHVAAVNHFMLRNLTAAEPSLDPRSDRVFDSALPEPQRGDLPGLDDILAFRETVAGRTHQTLSRIAAGAVGAPQQLNLIAVTMLTAIINHEYQHGKWMEEVRTTLGGAPVAPPESPRVVSVEGYWLVHPRHLAEL